MKLEAEGLRRMQPGANGTGPNGKMKLMDAALVVERMQSRAAHAGEVEALKIARDALLTIVAEGYVTLIDRLTPELTSVEAVRSGLTQAEACGLHPAPGQLK